ncbi:hypothetical protein BDB01DRAFT_849590 [Pilobolus umbonatus]|nr:hypothetical protein BDB01DRAFT_849590 [Pilobolus umbonatus]
MLHSLLDRNTWNTLRSSRWLALESVHELCRHLSKIDYNNVEERKEARKMLEQCLNKKIKGKHLFKSHKHCHNIDLYINVDNPQFKQTIQDLNVLLSTHERPSKDLMPILKKKRRSGIEKDRKYTDIFGFLRTLICDSIPFV